VPGDLISSEVGLWFSAISATIAAVLCGWGGFLGIVRHRVPRILVAVAVAVIAVSYWVDLAEWSGGVDMRRGAGWVLWPSLAWTAWSGVRYSRHVVAERLAVAELEELLDEE